MAAETSKKSRSDDVIATGRRKTAVARVRLRNGSGTITVNGRPMDAYFPAIKDRVLISGALEQLGKQGAVNIDIRVDDHAEPIAELRRLQRVHGAYYDVFRRHLPRRADPTGTLDRAAIMREIEAHRRGLGLYPSNQPPLKYCPSF
jgi:hypothetical protein